MLILFHFLSAHVANKFVFEVIAHYYLVIAILTFEHFIQLVLTMVHYSRRYSSR